jgi:Predicted Peptidoglycan domain
MNWVTILPLIIQGLTAIEPLASGASQTKISAAGSGLVPVLQTIIGGLAPGSQAKVSFAISAATGVYDPDAAKWIQKILNLAGSNIEVDGALGPLTLAAVDSFASKELGIIPGSLISVILANTLKSLAESHSAESLADRPAGS